MRAKKLTTKGPQQDTFTAQRAALALLACPPASYRQRNDPRLLFAHAFTGGELLRATFFFYNYNPPGGGGWWCHHRFEHTIVLPTAIRSQLYVIVNKVSAAGRSLIDCVRLFFLFFSPFYNKTNRLNNN